MNIPQHIVLFPDGNRRWAKGRGLKTLEGHTKGYDNLVTFAADCQDRGVKVLTAFGFSTENWKRSPEEVAYLMRLLEKGLFQLLDKFKTRNIRLRVIGQKDRLPDSLKKAVDIVEEETKNNTGFVLNLAISYGGKWDILQAVQKAIKNGVSATDIDEKSFETLLSTSGLPDPDLVIRAGGEMRLSNFVLWQAAYAELYFSPKMWPDFAKEDFDVALAEFDRRTRRFGG